MSSVGTTTEGALNGCPYPEGGCYEIENPKTLKLGDFADFKENALAFG